MKNLKYMRWELRKKKKLENKTKLIFSQWLSTTKTSETNTNYLVSLAKCYLVFCNIAVNTKDLVLAFSQPTYSNAIEVCLLNRLNMNPTDNNLIAVLAVTLWFLIEKAKKKYIKNFFFFHCWPKYRLIAWPCLIFFFSINFITLAGVVVRTTAWRIVVCFHFQLIKRNKIRFCPMAEYHNG